MLTVLVAGLLLTACATLPDPAHLEKLPETRTPEPVPESLSLEDAVRLALAHHPDLRIQEFEPLIAGTFLTREQARFSPELFGEGSRRELRSSETARATGEQFNAEIEQTRLQAGVRQQLSTGTGLEVSALQLSESSNRAPDQEEARLSLSLTQALLQGRGRETNLLGVQRARLDIDISEAEFSAFTEAVLADVETAYWNLWLAHQTIRISRNALEVAEKQLIELRARIEVGTLPRNDEAVAMTEVALRRQVLIDARANLTARQLQLLQLIAPHSAATGPLLPETAPVLPEPDPGDTADLHTRLALQSRFDLREAMLRAEQRRLDTQLTRNGLLPRLDFFATLSKTGFGPDSGDAWSDLDGDGYDIQAGLRLQRTLGNRPEDSRDQEARFRQAQADLAIENLRQRIRTDVHLALNEQDRARQQVQAAAETRRLQELTVGAEIERFEAGAGTALMVAQAQRDLLSAQIEEQRARVQARLALLRLHRAEGSLLDRRGIGR
jgi:outer membrane protein TolC